MGIRTFDAIIALERGQASLTEALGLEPSDLAVIETDGSYEQVDLAESRVLRRACHRF